MSSVSNLSAGSVISNYEIIDTIAQGGMGVVYHARHRYIKRDVALKVLFPHLASDEEFTQRFQREGQAMATLRHPNIVEVYDASFADGYYFMAIELLPGGTLNQQLGTLAKSQQRMPVDQALRITREIALALDYAHGKGFVHRDIKPSNILIAADGRYVLTDFGIVHTEGATKLTRNLTTLGTPEYMSPEQAQGQPVDGRSDIYSLGIVLYEMLAGKPPFSSDTPWATVYQHIKEPPPPITASRTDVPPAARDIVNRAIAKKPEDRFQTGKELAAAIDRIIGTSSGAKAAAAPRKSGRGLVVVGVIASLAIVIAGAVLAISSLANSNSTTVVATLPATTEVAATKVAAVLPTATELRPTVTMLPTLTAEPTAAPTLAPTATGESTASATDTALPASPTPKPATPTVVTAATSAPALTPAKPGQLLNFEQPINWRRGDEPYGTFAQSNEQVHDGTYSGKLTYDVPAVAKNYVVFLTDINLGSQATGLVAWVYGDGKGNFLHTWIKDSTGQRRQYTFGRVSHTGWRQMAAMFDNSRGWPNVHIDGPDSTALNYPLSLNALVMDVAADNSGGSGAIYLDEMNITTQAVSQSTPQPDVTSAPGTPAPQPTVGAGTPTPTANFDFGFRNYTVGRENWGKPTSADGCGSFTDKEGVYLKYEVNFDIVNTGPADISGYQIVFISNINNALPRCVSIAPNATIPVGGSTHGAFLLYMQGQGLSVIEVRTPVLTKRLCVDPLGKSISPC
jgi:hypothetical protein